MPIDSDWQREPLRAYEARGVALLLLLLSLLRFSDSKSAPSSLFFSLLLAEDPGSKIILSSWIESKNLGNSPRSQHTL